MKNILNKLVRTSATLCAAVMVLAMSGVSARAACTVPNAISNGQIADATKITGNFNAVAACVDDQRPGGATNSVQYNAGSGTFGGIGPLANGQVVVGSAGAAPQAATLSAGPGIDIANGPGSITISAPGSGGALSASQVVVLSPGTSGSAFATKGQQLVPHRNYTAYSVRARFPTLAGASYKAEIFTISGGTIGTIVGSSNPVTPGASPMLDTEFPLSSPVLLNAGAAYAVCVTRTDGTTTFILPLISGTGTYNNLTFFYAGASFSIGDAVRVASTDPQSGQTVDTISITSSPPYEIGLVGAH